ncbi:mechanosensitive ion channel family protein [Bordetella genomosp. 4]|uniref:mechanosensitive ion channel family protein n=1 Tax=Bordetella genomosp. 4 TaxID=463044 RepID=UPI000B9DDC02|nr:mechanosensitive ion channel family protein [Bordetella genomosp. 4]OZI49610.1 mechanosensitive ion channel protein MscS [Bordetella genomosp. 4]
MISLPDLYAEYGAIWGAWFGTLALAAVLFIGFISVLNVVRRQATSRMAEGDHPYASALLAVVTRTNRLIVALLALMIGMRLTQAVFPWQSWVSDHLWFVLLALQLALWLDVACRSVLTIVGERLRAGRVTITLLSFLVRTVVWVVALLAILDNLGVNITALVTSLGIGGVAVALAVQTILSDLFASISIGLDKPFEVGDFIVFGSVAGSIEHIGLKTTRIRSLGGEQIVCSNTELLKQTIQNYKRMEQRRIIFTLRVPYDTPADTLLELPADIKAQIEAQAATRFDRAHVARFGDYGLEIEAVYYVLSADYNRYMDIQQAINLGIVRAFGARHVTLRPQERTLHLREDAVQSAEI